MLYLDVGACGVHLLWVEDDVSVLELLVDGAVGEAAPADADALQHAVASQLMKHQSADEFEVCSRLCHRDSVLRSACPC